ncbi:hypothetical protein KORDIASMS9_03495 [Kordia sp. SMS9]|uniref:hypothetical protein n=1 Tax=Kordia sp. SMS9 TaxID=2282170 RepID=UPI000E0D8D7E|nr:hypothetical protein [Kordia sp. SMS9]AXG71238.1 hypothetical protein KORDIASMS9_03495 [Kordia sp. SMS9]
MQSSDTFLLESKLKRLKISFSKENGKIMISQAKRDYVILIGLVFFPLLFGICATVFLIVGDGEIYLQHFKKIIFFIVFFYTLGIGSLFRILIKHKENKDIKILGYKEIILKTKETSTRFDAHTIDFFDYTVEKMEEEVYHGTLYLIDTNQNEHLLMGFDAETEQYVTDDLQWFVNYFEQHVQLNS